MEITDASDSPEHWPYPIRCVLDDGTEGWGSTAKAAEWAATLIQTKAQVSVLSDHTETAPYESGSCRLC
jgi:hypothetical protein